MGAARFLAWKWMNLVGFAVVLWFITRVPEEFLSWAKGGDGFIGFLRAMAVAAPLSALIVGALGATRILLGEKPRDAFFVKGYLDAVKVVIGMTFILRGLTLLGVILILVPSSFYRWYVGQFRKKREEPADPG